MRSKQSVTKQASTDASEYAAAYMSIGEGAGNRRKLIEGTVEYKMEFVPGYRDAFNEAHSTQNMAKHAEKARKDNRRREVSATTERNAKALLTGNHKNADLKVLLIIGAAAAAHKTGLDRKAWDFGKKKVENFKRRYKTTYAAKADADGVFRITDV